MTRKFTKRTLLVAVSTIVLAGMGAGGSLLAERHIVAMAGAAGIAVETADVDILTGRVALSGVTLPLGEHGRIRVGHVRGNGGFALVPPALAAENVTLSDVRIDGGALSYTMPKIEIVGSTLGRAQLLALFDKSATESVSKRVMGLTAAMISIPEFITEQKIAGESQTATYRDILMKDIVAGRIGTVTGTGGSITTTAKGPSAVQGTFGAITVEDFDLVQTVRVYSEPAGPNDKEFKRVYGKFSMENFALKGNKGANIVLGRLSGSEFRARPTKTPWLEALRGAVEKKDFDKSAPAESARFVNNMLDIVEAFDIGTMEVTGITIDDPSGTKPGKGRIARIAYKGGPAAEARVEDFEVSGPDGQVRLGLMAFSGFSFAPTFEALREMLGKPDANFDDMAYTRFIPALGTTTIRDMVADVPNERAADRNERIKATLKGFEFTATKAVNGIPTSIRTAVENFAFTIPAGSKDAGIRDLFDMGYRAVDVSLVIEGAWNEPGNEFVVKEISAKGVDMGSATVRGTIGNVTKDVFSGDPTVMQIALIGATAKTLSVAIDNRGLVDRAIERDAKRSARKPDEVRKQYGVAAAVAIPAMLGNSSNAKLVANAVARFIGRPGKLDINARTRDGSGLGLADVMAAGGDPGEILARLDITATAE